MKIYIVNYRDYDSDCIEGVFTNKTNAEKCKEYHLKLIEIRDCDNGDTIELDEIETSDDIDYNAKILELEEQQTMKNREKEETLKQKEIEEYNRIKERYRL